MEVRAYSADAFQLLNVEKSGGMARVKKALLIASKQLCALKFAKWSSQDNSAAASFNRELAALSDLSHGNIVRMIGVGTDGTERFLVLEWLEETLSERILQIGPLDWSTFYESIGRPLLEALRYAHSRQYVHRDLKPPNVMFDKKGQPKITDFGIAREQEDQRPGMTFNKAGTPPWTAAEPDDRVRSETRDLYSWAAIAVACVSGSLEFRNVQDFRTTIGQLDPTVPGATLLACLADNPAKRPATATELLWDLDDYYQLRSDKLDFQRLLGVELSPAAHKQLEDLVGTDVIDNDRARIAFDDLVKECEVSSTPDGAFDFTGTRFRLTAIRPSRDSPWLFIRDIRPASTRPASIPAFRAKIAFIERRHAPDLSVIRANVEFLERFLSTFIEREQEAQRRLDEERYLSMLQDVLAGRLRALRHLPAIPYSDGKWEGGDFVVQIPADELLLVPEKRIIRAAGGILVFEAIRVSKQKAYLRPVGARRGHPSAAGLLQVDTVAQRRALERQEDAVKVVRSNLAVLPTLRDLILHPDQADRPEEGERPNIEGLSPDKDGVVRAALGLREILVVKGPPGTGKTRLITEVVRRYLTENPRARVLLAAQTHIAVDHVLEKLLESAHGSGRIVRIARADEDKVAEAVRGALLQQCVQDWCKTATAASRKYMAERGRDLGLNVAYIELFVRLEALVRACDRQVALSRDLHKSQAQLGDAESGRIEAADEERIELATVATMTIAELQEQQKLVAELVLKLRAELRALGDDGAELADLDESSLRDWCDTLGETDEKWLVFKGELKLQVAWLDLLGQLRQFEEIVLTSASIVAGTCVGLGSSDAFSKTRFDLCIIDEASKATASEALIPMVRSERFLIVGDPEQLPPFERDEIDVEGYSETEVRATLLDYLIERLPEACVYELTHQHRMCRSIGELISHSFYKRSLVNERPDTERPGWLRGKFPKPVVWLDTMGAPQRKIGHSFVNRREQDLILSLLGRLQHGSSRAKRVTSVAIIAGYAAQANELDGRIQRGSLKALSIEVATVDSFQGREADVCIFSVTLSNTTDYLGFLRSFERLNVALSRAKDLLVVVGAQDFCYSVQGKNPFQPVIDFIEAHPETCETLDASN